MAFNPEMAAGFGSINNMNPADFVDHLTDVQFTPTFIPDNINRTAYGTYPPPR
jgi:hypothetical protein